MSQPGFGGIDAVKTGRVYIADINMARGLSEMVTMLYYAKWLHPDLFQDIDPRSVHAELLQKYAHMDIDDIHQVYPEDPVEVPAAAESLSTRLGTRTCETKISFMLLHPILIDF